MAEPAKREATYEDLLAVPAPLVAEILHGELVTHPRPATRHARAASVLGGELMGPFDRQRGGPGGWLLLDEPELHLGRNVLVPDLAGWRRAHLPELPHTPAISTPPDWACEVLSLSTAATDRADKMPIYADRGVAHLWLIDPMSETLEVFRLQGDRYLLVGVWRGAVVVSVEPFAALALELGALWSR